MNLTKTVKSKVSMLFLAVILVISQFAGVAFPVAASVQAQAQTVKVVEWNFDSETPFATDGIEGNLQEQITLVGANGTGYVAGFGTNSRAINSNGWNTSEDAYWLVQFSTDGYEELTLSARQFGSNTGPRDFQVQYSIDGTSWSIVPNGEVIVGNNWTSGYVNNLVLPEVMNNQEQVFVRWLNTSGTSISGATVGSTGTSRIDDIVINGQPLGTITDPINPPVDEDGPISIKEARGMMGQEVTVEGIVNVDQGLLQTGRFNVYIQDEEAGIQLFNFSTTSFPAVKEGDRLQVTGVVGMNSGVTQITVSDVQVLETGQELAAKQINLSNYQSAATADDLEGQLVTFEGYIRNINDFFNGGTTIGIINNDFEGVDIRVWESTGIDLSQLERNTWYEITAISSKFNASYQVLPRSNADFKKLEEQKPEPTTANREFQATVAAVVDGDTIRLTTPVLGATNVRFLNMDTAETYHSVRNELDQHQMDFGKLAGDHLRTMISDGDTVTLRLGAEPLDGYGRLLAEVITLDGLNTNLQMVRDGMAPTYFIYPFESDVVLEYAEAARLAREEGLGIWNPENPLLEMPFVFRARERGSDLSRYVGHIKDGYFVAPDHYEIVEPEYRVFFTKAQAVALGYTPLQLSDREVIDMDKNALGVGYQGTDSAEGIVYDVVLETTGVYGSTITWESSNEAVIATTGVVTNPRFEDVTVTLTATIAKGSLVETKEFTVVVKPAIVELVSWNFDSESPVATGGLDGNRDQAITTVGSEITGYVAGFGSSSRAINSNGWDGSGENYWSIQFNTEGYKNVTLSSRQFGSNTGPRDFVVQYSLDGENWLDIENGSVTVGNNWTSGVVADLLLPADVENQESVYVRWFNTSNVSINGGTVGSGGTSRIDDIFVSANEGRFGEEIETPEQPEKDFGSRPITPPGHLISPPGRQLQTPGKPENPGKPAGVGRPAHAGR